MKDPTVTEPPAGKLTHRGQDSRVKGRGCCTSPDMYDLSHLPQGPYTDQCVGSVCRVQEQPTPVWTSISKGPCCTSVQGIQSSIAMTESSLQAVPWNLSREVHKLSFSVNTSEYLRPFSEASSVQILCLEPRPPSNC